MLLYISAFLNLFRIILFLILALLICTFNKSKALYLFLKLSGPSFMKLGQLLAVRPDLVGDDLAKRLSIFHDKIPPFSCRRAKKIIKKEIGQNINDAFIQFSPNPIASASIAQVYKCKKINGQDVALKILRPKIAKIIKRDIVSLKIIACMVWLFSRYFYKNIHDIINVLKFCAHYELDLLNEASAASQIKDNLKDCEEIYVPDVHWDLTTSKIIVTSWVDGIPLSDISSVNSSNIDKIKAANNLVIGYLNQVYRDGFFHGDMHPGNLFLMPDSRIAMVDYGIIGIINKKTRIAIARILDGYSRKDYDAVAKAHLYGSLIPKNTNITEFTLDCRVIGETLVGKSIKEISFADLLAKLLKMTRKYNTATDPELLLLQKTIMLIEGVGVSLNSNLNIWDVARPWVANWAKLNLGFDAVIRDCSVEFIEKFFYFSQIVENNFQNNKNNELLNKLYNNKKLNYFWQIFALTSFALSVILLSIRF